MIENTTITSTRLSQSGIWEQQSNCYDTAGINQWDQNIPYYATNNNFITNQYAETIVHFIKSHIRKNPYAKFFPFYILELGAGTGKLGFLLLKKIKKCIAELAIPDIQIKYIMSDRSVTLIQTWKKHPALKPFIQSGMLDLCQYDAMSQLEVLNLECSGARIKKNDIQNPFIAIANYVFRELPADMFCIDNGVIMESHLIENITNKTTDAFDFRNSFNHTNYECTPIDQHYYQDFHINNCLHATAHSVKEGFFAYPIGALHFLGQLQTFSNNKWLLLATDVHRDATMEANQVYSGQPIFHKNGFSFPVCFQAIEQYMATQNATVFSTHAIHALTSTAFLSGIPLHDYPELMWSLEKNRNFSTGDYLSLFNNYLQKINDLTLSEITTFLNLSGWDIDVFNAVYHRLLSIFSEQLPSSSEYWVNHLSSLLEYYYYLPHENDLLFNAATLLQTLRSFKAALHYYRQSIQYHGENDIKLHNVAMCLFVLNKTSEALSLLEAGIVLYPESDAIAHLFETIKTEAV